MSNFLLLLKKSLKEHLLEQPLRSILICLEEMFDLSYIFSHSNMKSEIDKSRNGFVSWRFIFSQQKFKDKLAINEVCLKRSDEPIAGALFHYIVNKYSGKLRSNPGGVRRLGAFDAGEIKYLLVRNYPIFLELK